MVDSFLLWFAKQEQFTQFLGIWFWAFFCGVLFTFFLCWFLLRFLQKNNHLQLLDLKARNDSLEGEIKSLIENESEQRSVISRLRTLLEQEQQNSKEKIDLLDQAKEQLRLQFSELASEILDEKASHFGRESEHSVGSLLAPFQEQLTSFRKRVESIHYLETKDRSALQREIATLKETNQQISREALDLTRALKGDKRIQGSWGELVLVRALEQSALRKGIEYETQVSLRDPKNRIRRPDVLVHLPEGRDVIVDAKVSLVAWEKYVNCDSDEKREHYLRLHIKAIRDHIKVLGEKDYAAIPEIRSLDFVLLFMPIEAAFAAAFQADENLFSDAVTSNIVLVSPTTLLTSLRTIETIWAYEKQNQNAKEIAEHAAALYDKFCSFTEDMERMGKQLASLQGSYDTALLRLCRGRGNLISKVEKFPQLGVKVKKAIPPAIKAKENSE